MEALRRRGRHPVRFHHISTDDGDYGTVLNRFLMQAGVDYPLTVHGTSGHTPAHLSKTQLHMNLKNMLRTGLNRMGFDVIRLHRSPQRTLLGLAGLDIGTVIDVGANKGQFARMIAEFFPCAELYCFEPLDDPFGQLSAWAQTQNGRVHCLQLALGDEEGEAEMPLHEQHTPSSSLLASTTANHRLFPQTQAERMTRIRVSTLDRALEDALDPMPREILLKLDVQGFEDRVLRGGTRVLSQCRAVVLEACLDPLYEGQADFLSLAQFLREAGFMYAGNLDQNYGDDGRVMFLDAVFVK